MDNELERRGLVVDLDKSTLFVPFHIALMENENYTSTEKMVYLALKSFCISERFCFPSQSLIMKRSSIKSNRTLTTTLQSLEAKGVILVIPEFCEDNRRTSNTYYLAAFDFEKGDFNSSSLDTLRSKKTLADERAKGLKQGSSKGSKKVRKDDEV